jgi:hypothetical protein
MLFNKSPRKCGYLKPDSIFPDKNKTVHKRILPPDALKRVLPFKKLSDYKLKEIMILMQNKQVIVHVDKKVKEYYNNLVKPL